MPSLGLRRVISYRTLAEGNRSPEERHQFLESVRGLCCLIGSQLATRWSTILMQPILEVEEERGRQCLRMFCSYGTAMSFNRTFAA